jgi:hypothetical protein
MRHTPILILSLALLPVAAEADVLRSAEQLRQFCEAGKSLSSGDAWPAAPLSDAGLPQSWAALIQTRNQARERARIGLQSHEAVIAPGEFQFLPFADDIEHLVVSTNTGLPLLGGAATIVLDGTSLGFVMDEASAADLIAAHRLGGVALKLIFDFSPMAGDGGDRPLCEAADAGMVPRLHGRLLEATLFDPLSDAIYASVESPHGTAERSRRGGVLNGNALTAAPRAEVTGLEVEGGRPFADAEASLLRAAVEERSVGCYARALTENGGLKGALVFGLNLGAAGEVDGVETRIDVLGDAAVTACSIARLGTLLIPRSPQAQPLRLRTTVVFQPE